MVAPPYATAIEDVVVNNEHYRLKRLVDRQQFHDPAGDHESAGVVPAHWSLFGVTWDAGFTMAELMSTEPIDGKRFLEIGGGLGLPSLVLHRRGADITASDIHPLAREFFEENLKNNDLPPMPFVILDWSKISLSLGQFDVVFASDVLYEYNHVESLAKFVAAHCTGEFILTDPGRTLVNAFSKHLKTGGFTGTTVATGKARVIRYSRST